MLVINFFDSNKSFKTVFHLIDIHELIAFFINKKMIEAMSKNQLIIIFLKKVQRQKYKFSLNNL
jgi:hypothetical protein